MSYEGLFIAKGWVTLDIPLCDSSSTLMTLHLLYDCYIQLSTFELHLKICYITMYMYPCEIKWIDQAMLGITMTQTSMEVQLFKILLVINSSKLMPRSLIRDGVHGLKGDIFMEPDSCLHSIRVHYSGYSIQLV